ncbi:hypothetical protein HHK36_029462 [Tetracentron sinense]|uniref:Uncharacterized protein n=1 Tax=Tetracentron sinense TaxID=13715 RepID=A0A834YD16_TETSI|nr:hypothetical protein HHK36_029462 [Tetracentron sinense]
MTRCSICDNGMFMEAVVALCVTAVACLCAAYHLMEEDIINRQKTMRKKRKVIYGSSFFTDQVIEQWAHIPVNVNARRQANPQELDDESPSFMSPSTQAGLDDGSEGDAVESSMHMMGEAASQLGGSNAVGSWHQGGKRTTRSRNTKVLNETMSVIATTMVRLVQAIEWIHYVVDEEALVQKIEDLEGADETTRILALEFLSDNPTKRKTFMQLTTNERRGFFISRHLPDYDGCKP